MWFVLVPPLVYLGVGVLTLLLLVVLIVGDIGFTDTLDIRGIRYAFKYEGIYAGIRCMCSDLFSGVVLAVIVVLGSPLLWALLLGAYILDPEFRRGS